MGKKFSDFPFLILLLITSLHSLPLTFDAGASLSKAQSQNGVVTMELWCVAKNNAEDTALQAALDWACGPGGADCDPIQQGGPCYDASDVQSMASFAFNDYYLKNGMTEDACNFNNAAAITSLNPSHDQCKFPSSLAVSNGSRASPSTAVGLGPSEDTSGFNSIASQCWFWTLFSTLFLFFFASYYL